VTEGQYQAPITPEELEEILRHSGGETLLVGGQSLAVWAIRYNIEPTGELSTKVTSDADFLGTKAHAKALGKALKWKVWLPNMDDGGGQTGKVTKLLPDGGIKQIDYLSGIVGLETARIQARAVEMTLPSGITIRVLHPLDVLESRLRNLHSLPSKRNAVGVAQAALAVEVVKAFFREVIAIKGGTRTALSAAERVANMALDRDLVAVTAKYGIDPLDAVPASEIDSVAFQTQRWSQILRRVSEARAKYAKHDSQRRPLPARER
jgi:hypothetical protein